MLAPLLVLDHARRLGHEDYRSLDRHAGVRGDVAKGMNWLYLSRSPVNGDYRNENGSENARDGGDGECDGSELMHHVKTTSTARHVSEIDVTVLVQEHECLVANFESD